MASFLFLLFYSSRLHCNYGETQGLGRAVRPLYCHLRRLFHRLHCLLNRERRRRKDKREDGEKEHQGQQRRFESGRQGSVERASLRQHSRVSMDLLVAIDMGLTNLAER